MSRIQSILTSVGHTPLLSLDRLGEGLPGRVVIKGEFLNPLSSVKDRIGVAMIDVFSRVMAALEPERGRRPSWWLLLVGAIGGELFYAFGLFDPLLPW